MPPRLPLGDLSQFTIRGQLRGDLPLSGRDDESGPYTRSVKSHPTSSPEIFGVREHRGPHLERCLGPGLVKPILGGSKGTGRNPGVWCALPPGSLQRWGEEEKIVRSGSFFAVEPAPRGLGAKPGSGPPSGAQPPSMTLMLGSKAWGQSGRERGGPGGKSRGFPDPRE